MKEFKIKLYSYDELEPEAKQKAFYDHELFLRENPAEYEDDKGEFHYDNMDTWTLKEIKEYVEDCIRMNEYYFFSSGEKANTITYTGEHSKSGQTEMIIGQEHFKEVY